jgi:P-type E1-E2 ATPase
MHPVAQAIRAHLGADAARDAGPLPEIRDLGGQGRAAEVEGGELVVGSAALFEDRFEPAEPAPGCSAVWFGYDRRAAGCFLLTDSIRPEAAGAVAELGRLGLELELVSGDRKSVTESVAAAVGIGRAAGGMTIEDKVERMRELSRAGAAVAFVGDGTNDALAMAEGAASVAVGGATDEALSASGFVELHGGLAGLPRLFALGRRLSRVIRANYVWAFAFNTLFIPVAALGRLVPLAAMALMLVSSAAVLLNSLRLRR